MFCEMGPPIKTSIARISPRRWILGSSMVCESVRDPASKPADAIIDWQDGGDIFYLRKSTANDLSGGDVDIDRVHTGGTSAAVWCLGENASGSVTRIPLPGNPQRITRGSG
ncbi:hypothetical protein C8A01DRAFT_36029 [Parachaetomium inaequale]|uniref:Uncharacterized protein n=1 Tax=Parachaetomium inaequale TaxID=2588326 RepID=A0AAN6SR44_9PEZI|nr:hypothetical protein C8A01DRAFT_36029 [Parachaetomium inaequale]